MSYSDQWAKVQLEDRAYAIQQKRLSNIFSCLAVLLVLSLVCGLPLIATGTFASLMARIISTHPDQYFPQVDSMATSKAYYEARPGTAVFSYPTRTPKVVKTPTRAIKITPPVPTMLAASPASDWRWHSLDLYQMRIKLPPGWTIESYNRRPEPTEEQLDGHDCANYMISDREQISKLILSPACGSSEGIPNDCHQDTVMISTQKSIVRYYDSQKAAYVYTHWGNPIIKSTRGDYRASYCFVPPALTYQSNQDFTAIAIDFFYLGSQDQLSKTLPVVDAIILTLGYP